MQIQLKEMLFLPIALILFLVGIIFDNAIIGFLITIGIGIYTVVNHKNGLILLFVYLPIRPVLIELNPLLKLIGDIIILAVLLKVIYMYRTNWRSLFHFNVFEIAFLLFCLVGSISALITGVKFTAVLFQLRSFILLFSLYYIVKRLNISKHDIVKFAWTIFVMVMIICLHGLIEKLSLRGFLIPEAWKDMSLSATNRIRIYGLVGNPNGLSLFLSFSLIVLIYLKEIVNRNMVHITNVCLVLLMATWVMTLSRGTWIAFAISLVVYIILTKKWRILKSVLYPLVLGIILIVIPVLGVSSMIERTDFGTKQRDNQKEFDQTDESFSERLSGTFDNKTIEGSKESGRIFIVKKGFEIFKEHPIIGTGFGTFGDSATLSYDSPIYQKYNIDLSFYSDNQYIQVIVQTGVIGTLLFSIFLMGIAYFVCKNKSQLKISSLLISIILGAYFIGIVYNAWESYVFTLFFYTMLGYASSQNFRKSITYKGR